MNGCKDYQRKEFWIIEGTFFNIFEDFQNLQSSTFSQYCA